MAPAGPAVPAIERDRITFIDWPVTRQAMNPLAELKGILKLWRIYRRIRPDIVHHFTPKPNIYGAIAAQLAGVPVVIASVNGLGYTFTEKGVKSNLIRPIVSILYRLAFRMSEAAVFQNQDDISYFERNGLVPAEKVNYIPGGAGVDTSMFNPEAIDPVASSHLKESLGVPPDTSVVLMVGRMLWHKGIAEYVECARILGPKHRTCFLLVGPVDQGNPSSISLRQLESWADEGCVRYLGERPDIRELLAIADVVVLPSYREGLPRVLLEAAAMGKPMVASDVPGCRDVVDDGINGILVPPKDVASLVAAIEGLLVSSARRRQMGAAARHKALREFDEGKVVEQVLGLYDTLLARKAMV